ncbi:MAG: type IV secretion system DNA-binding domain-containing protein [Patescibacteria group bacterium]|nr:type IV secretion system DNA-binding domain-containing protein [Patescibacteria group bacterium]
MINSEITTFAETTFRNRKIKFGIKVDDRRRHMYLIGKTGMGKSTILENMIVADIRAGRGVAVVDPHGDLAEKVMQYIPAERIKDVIYFNPSDTDFPIAFNIVEAVDIKVRHLVASGLVGVFKKLWADSWGPRLEYILRNAILAVLDYPNSTLLSVIQMLSDKNYRKKVMAEVKDPVVKSFWLKEFASYADKFASEAVSPIQNKVGQFLSSSLIRNIVGQTRSSIDVRDAMDKGKILIMNLSKGHIGEDNSALLGAMMITKIQLAAMSRVDIKEKERKDFYLYIDEFQNFSTESFATILSEARKYHLNLIIAHQYMEQLTDEVKAAVFGNVGTLVAFRVGAIDAEELVKEFTPIFEEEDILNLPKYEFYVKLMIDGVASPPFSARGLPPLTDEERTNNLQKAVDWTRQSYAKPQAEVEEEIMRIHFAEEPARLPVMPGRETSISATGLVSKPNLEKPRVESLPRPNFVPRFETATAKADRPTRREEPKASGVLFDARCASCGAETKVPFKPDPARPVYCKNCLSELKKKKRDGAADRPVKKDRIDLSQISPSTLLARGAVSTGANEEGYVSLSKLKETGLSAAALAKAGLPGFDRKSKVENNPTVAKAMVGKPPEAVEAPKNSEKDLAEGEDIVFE